MFINEYSTLWLRKVKRNSERLAECFVMINTDFVEINSFGHLQGKVLENIELLSTTKTNFLYFEA